MRRKFWPKVPAEEDALQASTPDSVFIRILARDILEPPFLIFIYL